MANCADDVLNIERNEIGYSRWNDPEAGSKYGRWYAEHSGDSYYGTSGVPFCAMFQSWCFNQAGASAPGIPGAYCPWILDAGRNEGRLVYNEVAKPGDLLLFDWGGDGNPDHIGMCEQNFPNENYMQTIEGNTNNGQVARRTRGYSSIIGVIRPYYSDNPAQTDPVVPNNGIAVDGYWGPDTNTRLQQVLGTTVDGVISSQPNSNHQYVKAAGDGWEWVNDAYAGGSECITELQRRIGADPDGFFGPNSVNALESHYGIPNDRVLDSPSNTVMKLQEALNNNTI
jgi:hypothetical protein